MPAPSGDGNFQGINPQATQALINAVTSHVPGARATAEDYASQFARYGLSTGPVNALLADYGWATGAQGTAMLQRRYSLAIHQPSGNFLPGGWTSEGAGQLAYASNAAAAKAGSLEGQVLLALLEVGNDSAVLQEMSVLKANRPDVAYMAALFTALGTDGLSKLATQATGSSASAQLIRQTVAPALATASYGMKLTQSFLSALAPLPTVLYAGDGGPEFTSVDDENLSALAPFLLATGGKFSDQWLSALSPYVLNEALTVAGAGQLPPSSSAIWEAIANNPQFASGLFHQNRALLETYMTSPQSGNLTDNTAFGKFLVAATVAPKGDTSPLFKQNAADFVRMFGSNPVDTSATVRQVMAIDAVKYFSDLKNTVTAAAPGAGSTMGLSASQWGMFVQNAMKDKSAAAALIGYYALWRGSQPGDNIAQDGTGDNNTTPDYAGYWHHGSLGMLDYFFASNYDAAGTTAGHTNQGLLLALDTAASVIGPLVAVSLTLGPEASIPAFFLAMADMSAPDAIPVGTILGSGATSQAGRLVVNYATKYGLIDAFSGVATAPGTSPGTQGGMLVNVQRNWAATVASTWDGSQSKPGHPNFLDGPGVQVDSKGTSYIEYNGHSFTGDPLQYEKQYNGFFMDKDGKIKSTTAMTPAELKAYNAWLQDPAISFQNAAAFRNEGDGVVFQYVQNALAGGGTSNGGSGGIPFGSN